MTISPDNQRRPEFTIGDRLRKARTLRDLDVKQFAELIEVDRNTVSNYELEKTSPEKMKAIVLRQWAMATGVEYDWLRTGAYAQGPTGDGGNLRAMDYLADSSNVIQLFAPERQAA